jgi:F-type H+-transporting ATPase subunit b
MGAFIFSFILMFAGGGAGDGWWVKVDPYLNFPGFEFWRFMNLAIFVGVLIKLLRKPLSDAFKAKREEIRAELIKAEEEKRDALAKLTAVEGKLAQLETEKADILAKAAAEAEAEKRRIAAETAAEVARIKSQFEGDIARRAQQIRRELRRFSAEESVRIAEAKIRSQMNLEKDAELIGAGIKSMGGAK